EKSETWHEMFISLVLFIWKMFLSALDYMAAFLNRRSREHRYVAYVLAKEKERLKTMMRDELYDAEKTPSQVTRVGPGKINSWVREGQWLGLGRSMVGSGKVNGWVWEGQWLGLGRSMVGSGKVNGWVWEGQWLGLGRSMVGSGKV